MSKVVVVGTGNVGMSYAYAQLNQGGVNELVLIDVDKKKAYGEALDLNHGVPFAKTPIKISAGEYSDCSDADIVIITAGTAQKDGESRIDLLSRNAKIMESITKDVVASGFNGIFLIASNPVDIMATVVFKVSGFDRFKVIGSGTTLDSSRLRYELGNELGVDFRNIHSYVLGEHGDTEFVTWSKTQVSVKPLNDIIENELLSQADLNIIEKDVRESAYEIIEAKGSTHFGIGMALVRIVSAIINDECSILPLSTYLDGEYGFSGAHISVPVILDKHGIRKIIHLDLNEDEKDKLQLSFNTLKGFVHEIDKSITSFIRLSDDNGHSISKSNV